MIPLKDDNPTSGKPVVTYFLIGLCIFIFFPSTKIKLEIAFTNVSTVLTVNDIAKIIIIISNNSVLFFNNIEKKAKSGFTLLSTEIAIIPVIPVKKTMGMIIKKDS